MTGSWREGTIRTQHVSARTPVAPTPASKSTSPRPGEITKFLRTARKWAGGGGRLSLRAGAVPWGKCSDKEGPTPGPTRWPCLIGGPQCQRSYGADLMGDKLTCYAMLGFLGNSRHLEGCSETKSYPVQLLQKGCCMATGGLAHRCRIPDYLEHLQGQPHVKLAVAVLTTVSRSCPFLWLITITCWDKHLLWEQAAAKEEATRFSFQRLCHLR